MPVQSSRGQNACSLKVLRQSALKPDWFEINAVGLRTVLNYSVVFVYAVPMTRLLSVGTGVPLHDAVAG